MASQITHVVLAKKVQSYFTQFSEGEFLLGTLYPDIRYVGELSREETHVQNVTTFSEILTIKSAFLAGAEFHKIIDLHREECYTSWGVYELLPSNPLITSALKIYEDVLSYRMLDDWSEVVAICQSVDKNHWNIPGSDTLFSTWYHVLATYFMQAPNEGSMREFATAVRLSRAATDEILRLVADMQMNQRVVELVLRYLVEFPAGIGSYFE